jgi:hypothetical protein
MVLLVGANWVLREREWSENEDSGLDVLATVACTIKGLLLLYGPVVDEGEVLARACLINSQFPICNGYRS